MPLFPQNPVWTKKEEHFYEKIARSGLLISFAIKQATIHGFTSRTEEEVNRHFIFRHLPWKLIANTPYVPYEDEAQEEISEEGLSINQQGMDLSSGIKRDENPNFEGNMGNNINMGSAINMGAEPNYGSKKRKR